MLGRAFLVGQQKERPTCFSGFARATFPEDCKSLGALSERGALATERSVLLQARSWKHRSRRETFDQSSEACIVA